MIDKYNLVQQREIESRIFSIRGVQVMIDSHLAELYGVETKVLNQAVKRNTERFPDLFRFQLTEQEYEILRSQIVTSSLEHGGRRYLPYAFTEQGVAMLSAVLRSDTAVKVSIRIMNAFVEMRKLMVGNAGLFQRMDKVERKLLDVDEKFERIFSALESPDNRASQGIFFDGQVFDAYTFVSDLVRRADQSIILIDNYIDDSVLTLLAKRKDGVAVTLFTKSVSMQLALDVEKFNGQYPPVEVKELKDSHDRFLIIDESEIYHIGASLKDLGKKWFAFSKLDVGTVGLLSRLNKQGRK